MLRWLFLFIPAVLCAESAMPSLRFTGAPVDGGKDCSTCHTQSRSGAGSVTFDVTDYNPGVMQLIHVQVSDPSATTWGFQMTARTVTNPMQEAGHFAAASANVQVRCDDGTQYGSPGPCVNQLEFAEHMNAPRTGSGAGFEFDVTWTPPQPEIGAVTFYLSAVAGNGDGSALGDAVYTIAKTVSFTGACPNVKKPVVVKAQNAASFDNTLSPGALISVFGSSFTDPATKRVAALGDFVSGGFPQVLSCVAVQVTPAGSTTPIRLPVTYVQQDQINAQLPFSLPAGPISLVVLLNPDKPNQLSSDVATVTVQSFGPAFFTFSGTSSIAAQFAGTATDVADPSIVPGSRAAAAGDVITLYGTGFGPTKSVVNAGQLATGATETSNTVSVTIGGAAATVLYAGLSPGSISGLYQINVRVPSGVASGNAPVVAAVSGAQTQAGATIPIQ